MITVKKASEQHADGGTEAERYRLADHQEKSRLPYVFAAILALAVLFIRSATSFVSRPAEAEEAKPNLADPAPPRDDAVASATQIEALRPAAIDVPALPERVEDGTAWRTATNVIPFPSRVFKFADPASFSFNDAVPAVALASPSLVDAPTVATDSAPTRTSPTTEGEEVEDNPPDDTDQPATPVLPPVKPSPTERNRAPSHNGPIRLNDAMTGAVVMVAFSQLLEGATDADGNTLAVKNLKVSSGAFGWTEEGLVFSSHLMSTDAMVAFEYEVSDGTSSIARTATFNLRPGPILGTPSADVLTASERVDHVDGGEGDDLIATLGGPDIIYGGSGDDIISASTGDDTIYAGPGDDVVFAGPGSDIVWAGDGDDRVLGEAGDDQILGEAGSDTLLGGVGEDLLAGGESNDSLDGGDGDDVILGGDGDDVLEDGAGEDQVLGDAGNDTVLVALDGDSDIFVGGAGEDTLDLSAASLPVVVDFTEGIASSEELGVDQFEDFENVVGGSGNDTFNVADQPLRLIGGDGDDEFNFAVPSSTSSAVLIHQIVDFVLGDRVRVAEFELTMEDDDREDHFERYYRDRDHERDDEGLRLRIHSHVEDGQELTEFEFDFDGEEGFEMRILLHGHDHPFVYETSVA